METDCYLIGWQLKDGSKKYVKELSICKDPIWHGGWEFTIHLYLTIHFSFVDTIDGALVLSEKDVIGCILHLVQQMIEEKDNNVSHIFICDKEDHNHYEVKGRRLKRIPYI